MMLLKNDVKIKDIEDKIPDITNLAINTTLNANNEIKKEIPSIYNLVTNAFLNAKINEVKNEIPSITSLATTTAYTAVKNNMLDHSKYITTPEFNKPTAENFTARLKTSKFNN